MNAAFFQELTFCSASMDSSASADIYFGMYYQPQNFSLCHPQCLAKQFVRVLCLSVYPMQFFGPQQQTSFTIPSNAIPPNTEHPFLIANQELVSWSSATPCSQPQSLLWEAQVGFDRLDVDLLWVT